MAHDINAIVARCTRNGVTSWQAVAKQLGRSVDSVRAQFDRQYARAHVWAPSREPDPALEPPVDENDLSSPYPKGPGLKSMILRSLHTNGPTCVGDIATRLGRTTNSIRMRLSDMREAGLVENDSKGRPNGVYEWTWSLTIAGHVAAVTACAQKEREGA